MSSHVLMAALQFPEISSLVAAGGVDVFLPYDDQYTPAAMASPFRLYERRHLGPQRRLTKPGCGQRMLKTALARAMRYSQQRQVPGSGNQLQHVISERKRREKFNDSFHALKTVLPSGSKKLGQTSTLIIARDYVWSLKSKVRELEEKNQALQAQLATGAEEDVGQITRAGDVCTVKIVTTPARGNTTTDAVIRILQRLKDLMGQDVTLVSVSTGQDGPHRASQLTLLLKSASGAMWEEEAEWSL